MAFTEDSCLINAVVSMGRCNTQLEVYLAEFKGQIRLRASIQRKPCPDKV